MSDRGSRSDIAYNAPMPAPLHNVTHVCFGLGYLGAWGLTAALARWPRPSLRAGALAFGVAGFLAHSVFLAVHHPTPATPSGALLAVAWLLAAFTLVGALTTPRRVWALFALPVVAGLVGLSLLVAGATPESHDYPVPPWLMGEHFWGAAHGLLLLGAATGLTVGFLTSVMYLVQARRLRTKSSPLGGLRLLSLERLEQSNRRAADVAFPLLTLGLLLGAVLVPGAESSGWLSVKALGTVGLWVVCGLLFYLRYGSQVPARRVARLTVLAFVLTVLVLASAHPFAPGATP